jgi:predicted RNA-binding Zn-ribbon protein involved in translation (DUF1610 family)
MGTVDSNHTEKMIHFQERKKDLPNLKERLKFLEERYDTLKKAGIIPNELIEGDEKDKKKSSKSLSLIDQECENYDQEDSLKDRDNEWNDLVSETDRSDFDLGTENQLTENQLTENHCNIKNLEIDEQMADFNYLNIINSIEKEIKQIKSDILAIENNGEEYKYILNTGTLLFQYYDNVSNPLTNNRNAAPKSVWGSSFHYTVKGRDNVESKKGVGMTTGTSDPDNEEGEEKKVRGGISVKGDNKSLSGGNVGGISGVTGKQARKMRSVLRPNVDASGGGSGPGVGSNKMSRSEMLDEFKALTDSNWVKKTQSKDKHEESICEDCKIPKVLQYKESKYICPKCGVEEITQIDSDRPSFKDPPPDANYFAYKRINHFNELLAQFQAKESTHIPKEVFDAIKRELKKERKQIKDLDFELVKNYLKKYNDKHYTQYYDHIYHIINRLNGDKPLNMTPEMENNLRILFQKIQAPFNKYCPSDRKNFISYNFVFYKFCKLLGYNEFLHYFPLLKSKDKLYEQEKIWQKIMTDIGLPYK